MSVDRLRRLFGLPENPPSGPSRVDWPSVQAPVGVGLPQDYVTLIDSMGAVCVDQFIWVLHPTTPNKHLNLLAQLRVQTDVLDTLWKCSEVKRYPLVPNKNGIIPWAMTDNGDVCYWVPSDTGRWAVAVNAGRSSEWVEYSGSCTDFLVDVITKKLVVPIFPADFPSPHPSLTAIVE